MPHARGGRWAIRSAAKIKPQRTAYPPNKPMQPTPLCGDKTVAILASGSSKNTFPVYRGGAADGQGVSADARTARSPREWGALGEQVVSLTRSFAACGGQHARPLDQCRRLWCECQSGRCGLINV